MSGGNKRLDGDDNSRYYCGAVSEVAFRRP